MEEIFILRQLKQMEYKIFNVIRNKIKVPYIIRLFVGILLIFLALIPIIIPIFPGSSILGVFMIITAILFIVSPKSIKHTIKLRKGIIYLFKNIHDKIIIKRKIIDIKTHIKNILKYNK